jgi:hypothetical protein
LLKPSGDGSQLVLEADEFDKTWIPTVTNSVFINKRPKGCVSSLLQNLTHATLPESRRRLWNPWPEQSLEERRDAQGAKALALATYIPQ